MSTRSDQQRFSSRLLSRLAVAATVIAGLGSVANFVAAQEVIQCIDDPDEGIPAACESFAIDLQVTSVTDPFAVYASLQVGQTISGTYTVLTDVTDVDVSAENGRFLNAVECMTLDLGDRVMTVDLTPVEISLPPAPSDPGITVMNDIETGAPPLTIFSDTATLAVAGFGLLELVSTPEPADFVAGGGGFAFGYGDTCVSGIQTPCPPTVLTDDGIPAAAGDTTVLPSALMTFDFLNLAGQFATANADILAIDPTPVVPCPEPGFATALMAGVLVVAGRRPQRR